MRINGIVLAAGLSSRMGAFKPLLPLGRKVILERTIDSLLDAKVDQMVIVVGNQADILKNFIQARYCNEQVKVVCNSEYETTDMLTSVKLGIQGMSDCDGFFLMLGDMPMVSRNTFLTLKKAFEENRSSVIFPTMEGRRGHPPLIHKDIIAEIQDFHEDGGLRSFWKTMVQDITEVEVRDFGCLLDTDTKADYERLVDYVNSIE